MSNILSTVSLYSVFLPLIVGIINYRQIEASANILLLIIMFACVPHIATIVSPKGSLPVIYYNGYIFIDALLWPLFYFLSSKALKIRKLFLILMVLNLSMVVSYVLISGYAKRFYYEMVCVNSVFQTILVTIYFFELNNSNKLILLKKEPGFWFSLGLLFYATCTFFIFLFYYKINKYFTKSQLNQLWIIHHFFNAFMYILFAIGLSIKKSKKNV